ncbi:integral membrane protein (plasmid) [Legionella adelaidensis]|uniref:Integral membrane protein n=1 Tax=Legionella adelaidensis TaxID=45056 RepID=A0A0W0R3I7_9GAMM|nr:EamA family transporter [Legionella adelaidensis]KTC65594.1 integral membrane protein [Legionella adelaidensis]VEH85209.1 integral membrane protein [Legionella adelaidensis]
MPISHLLCTLLVVVIWGLNFIFVKFALDEMSPLMLCALRFLLASLPAIFFIKPPAIPFRMVATYGLIMFAMQFSFFFLGMHAGMTPGLASLVMQVQVFFSMLFAAIFLKDKPVPIQVFGALLAFGGIAIVALHCDQNVTISGFILILLAAATWGFGNLITKKAKKINMMALVVWGSFVASIPLTVLAFLFEGPETIFTSLRAISIWGVVSVLYIVYFSTWIGYGVWNWLISRYPVNTIVPFTLLVPVVGLVSSVIILDEPFQQWKLLASIMVLTGLCFHIVSARFASPVKETIANSQ